MFREYALFPKISVVNNSAEFRISPFSENILPGQGGRYNISIIPVKDYLIKKDFTVCMNKNNEIFFKYKPVISGEYKVGIYPEGKAWPESPSALFSFFAVENDMKGLFPFKGDLHMHTTCSDGNDSPMEMIVKAREEGLDFISITDHRIYNSSYEASRIAGEKGLDILVIPGEEINFCQGPGHIVSLNADRAVSSDLDIDLISKKQVIEKIDFIDELLETVVVNNDDGNWSCHDKWYKYCKTIADKIHEAGGFAVLAHPFWSSHGSMDLIRSTYDAVLAEGFFDAYEMFGGMTVEENIMSLSRIYQEQKKGKTLPVVGTSDSHSYSDKDIFGKIFTIVFTESLTAENILKAVSEYKSVPCIVRDSFPLLGGDFSLVEYGYFLLREFFPVHDKICKKTGSLFFSEIMGGDASSITARTEELAGFYSSCFNF